MIDAKYKTGQTIFIGTDRSITISIIASYQDWFWYSDGFVMNGDGCTEFWREDECFLTKEEAQAECDRRNSK